MPSSVLQPVQRRRRRRSKRPFVLLGVGVVAAAASLAATEHWPGGGDARPKTRAAIAPVRSQAASPAALKKLRAVTAEQRVAARLPFAPGTRLLVGGESPPLERAGLRVTARSAILVDASSGAVLWAKRPHQRRPVASTTKIMTGVLAIEHLPLRKTIRINPIVTRVALSREGLRARERVPVWKLLYGLLLFSGNDDALALAIGTSGSKGAFLELMNQKAHQLALHDTHFTSPSGVVDRGNYSSAYDLAALGRYAMAIPRFRAIVRTRIARVKWTAPTYAKTYVNKNQLLGRYRGANGVKTGWTSLAGHCLVASAHRGRTSLIAVVLHSADPYGDARRLLNLGFAKS